MTEKTDETQAPGAPGLPPYWASSAKTGVGTALRRDSPIWFTISHGIVTEVFYPFVDSACIRGLGFIVTDRQEFFSDELHDTRSEVSYLAEGVPGYRVVNRCRESRYEIEKTVLADPRRPVVLQRTRFKPGSGDLGSYGLFVLLEPHLDNQGADNTAWIGEFKGTPMLLARRGGFALALACSAPWLRRSAGFAGHSDGRLDLEQHKELHWAYQRAEQGHVVLTGEIDLYGCQGDFVLALGFGRDEDDAAHRARASLLQGFAAAQDLYIADWQHWQKGLIAVKGSIEHPQNLYQISSAVMRVHEAKEFPGGIAASLATPWGASKGDNDKGYHLVWPRDMIQAVGGLLACRGHEDARRVLFFLLVTQEADGHWPQNMFLNGRPSWNGIQLDETAFVILLVDLARREGALRSEESHRLWPMVRKAAEYLLLHGPVTPLDRWEEETGYFASTVAVEIAALLTAAELAKENDERELAEFLCETADSWNSEIESLIYATGTGLARDVGVEGYYVRFALPDQRMFTTPACGSVTLRNHKPGEGHLAVDEIVSVDALALVRFGLRAADDPRVLNTVRVIDHLLKVETPRGPSWHRYNEDGYGEHADGSPFDGTGIGRAWPLLTGERAHYELAAGHADRAVELARAMERFANDSGYLPEQVWDAPDIPEHQLFFGRPAGSAMPLVWAHAEYIKLRRSLDEGRVLDMPKHTVERYVRKKTVSNRKYWRFEQPCRAMTAGQTLRVEVLSPAEVHWTTDGWASVEDSVTRDSGLAVHYVDIPTTSKQVGSAIEFTFYWPAVDRWEGKNFSVRLLAASDSGARSAGKQQAGRKGSARPAGSRRRR